VTPGGDAASRESRSGSPPLPRPEPKRKKGMRTPGSSVPVEIRFGVTELDRDVTAREFLRAVSLISACGPGVLLLGPARRADATPSPPSKEGEKGSGVSVGAGLRGGVRVGTFGPRRPPHCKPSPPVGGRARCWGCGVVGHLLRSSPPRFGGAVVAGVSRQGDVEVPRRGVRPPGRESGPVLSHLWPPARVWGRPPRRHDPG